MDAQKTSIGLGIVTAFASSLCCIVPFIALLAGTSSIASSFNWINPLRPWLIGITTLALGFAWYQSLKPQVADDCSCNIPSKSFFHSKSFLGVATIFTIVMMAFPHFSERLTGNSGSNNNQMLALYDSEDSITVEFEVNGMTCGGCERHLSKAISKLEGILEISPSYENGNTIVKFDDCETNIEAITVAIESIDYKVISHKIFKKPNLGKAFSELEFSVIGMTCSGCEKHVCRAVQKLPGIESVSASFQYENTFVKFNPLKTSTEEIEKAIASTRYKAKLIHSFNH